MCGLHRKKESDMAYQKMAYIEFNKITKEFDGQKVLDSITINIHKGEFVTLLGPSGCGKTTLLRMLAGLVPVTSGTIMLDYEDITDREARKRNIGMVFQQYSLFPNMDVTSNIAFGLKIKHFEKNQMEEKVRSAVKLVELEGHEHKRPSMLSGGQQQRVALARSLVMEPKVLLMDEPFSAIDARLRRSLQKSIREIHKKLGLTSIFVTHDQNEAMIMSDVIYLMNKGHIVQSGSPVDLYTHPKTKFSAEFIGNYNVLSAARFEKMLRIPAESSNVAIRPETIEMTAVREPHEGWYEFNGTVESSISRGNVLSYIIESNGVQLKVDTMFRSFKIFAPGTYVFLAVEKHNCLPIEDD
jgi:putative spermidine/putrescine transport system ATP-binding protein